MSLYADLSRRYAQRFVQGAHDAGWHMEATGPDASYIGMSHWYMALYYRYSNDREMHGSIRDRRWTH